MAIYSEQIEQISNVIKTLEKSRLYTQDEINDSIEITIGMDHGFVCLDENNSWVYYSYDDPETGLVDAHLNVTTNIKPFHKMDEYEEEIYLAMKELQEELVDHDIIFVSAESVTIKPFKRDSLYFYKNPNLNIPVIER